MAGQGEKRMTKPQWPVFPLPAEGKFLLTSLFLYGKITDANAGIAQSVEQLIRNQQVVCSSHITSST